MACSRSVDEHRVAAAAKGRLDLGAPWRGLDQTRATALVTASSDRLGPGDEPGEPVGAVLGLHDEVDRDVVDRDGVVGDDDDLGGPGEGGRHADRAPHFELGERDPAGCRGRR